MIIRDYNSSDFDDIEELKRKFNISVPEEGKMIVAWDELKKKVVGFLVLRPVIMIEPIVSENPIAAIKLFDHSQVMLSINGAKVCRAFTKGKVKEQLLKKGWYQAFEGLDIMETNFY